MIEKTYVDQMRSVVAQIMRLHARVLLVSMVILLRNKVASECRAHVRIRKTVLVNIYASRDCVNVNVPNKTTVHKVNVARMVFA